MLMMVLWWKRGVEANLPIIGPTALTDLITTISFSRFLGLHHKASPSAFDVL